jgi:DNA-binding Xre family transcriptional regulator
MISYAPLWKTMKAKGATTYTLRCKGHVSGATVQRLQRGESISTNTLDMLCRILACRVEDIIVYIDEDGGSGG